MFIKASEHKYKPVILALENTVFPSWYHKNICIIEPNINLCNVLGVQKSMFKTQNSLNNER